MNGGEHSRSAGRSNSPSEADVDEHRFHTRAITPADIFDHDQDASDEIPRSQSAMNDAEDPARLRSPSAAELMPPPPRPSHPTLPLPSSAPTSGQNREAPKAPPMSDTGFEMPAADGLSYGTMAVGEPQSATSSTFSASDSPEGPLEPFDWESLESRYEELIHDKAKEFDVIWQEYMQLQDLFGVWCDVLAKHESDRLQKRHKTQEYYVRHEEADHEVDRQHYIGVVDAFKSALAMLGRF